MAKSINYNHFITKYIQDIPGEFRWQTTPLQIYPLNFISNHLKLPTPLLKADYHFIVFIYEGNFLQQIGTDISRVTAPAILYVPEGEVFSIKSLEGELNGFFILIESKVISSIINKVEHSELLSIQMINHLNHNNSKWLKNLCTLLYEELAQDHPSRKIGNGLLQALLNKLIDLNSNKKSVSRQHEIAQNFKQLLNKEFKIHKSVEFYAESLNISSNYLNRCIKSQYNKSCKQIIQETAIIQSQIQMLDSSKDISEIAFEMGFEDTSYFSRIFKKVTGQTPSSFKKQMRHDLS